MEYGPLSPEDKSWTALKSRGALVKAAPHIEDQVYKINAAFNQYHKHGKLVTGKKIHKRTCDFIMRQDECKTVNKALVELLIKMLTFRKMEGIRRISGDMSKMAISPIDLGHGALQLQAH